MTDFEQVLLMALGFMMLLEGIGPFVFTTQWRRAVSEMSRLKDDTLRIAGLIVMVLGLILLYVAKD